MSESITLTDVIELARHTPEGETLYFTDAEFDDIIAWACPKQKKSKYAAFKKDVDHIQFNGRFLRRTSSA